ncbi:MAG: hypothetical protein L0Y58_00650 [Verrucomicrobia subdivision 3 bacterium]|nr:hypothetical protein [Limisphaerales bacterium]
MKHPNRDEWVPYVFGEARSDDARRLSAHLQECAECAAEVAGWQRSLKQLDSWELPRLSRGPNIIAPVFRWAMAAAIVLAAGIAVGRWTAPDVDALHAAVEASIKQSVVSEMRQVLAMSEARLLASVHEVDRDLWQGVSEALSTAREQDRQATLALLRDYQRAQDARFVNLRRDLETVALSADQEIRRANFRLTQLAGINRGP